MADCVKCRGELVRIRRNLIEKIIYSAIFKCKQCGSKTGRTRPYFARYCHCPKCGGERVRPRSKPDKIDKVLTTPMSVLQRLLGGHLYHCVYCRIQFYDLRKLSSSATNTAKLAD